MTPSDNYLDGPLAPLPGTGTPKRGLFIDRWGTLLEPPSGSAKQTYGRLEFTPGAQDALFRAAQAGYNIYLLGNEDAVAQGHVKDAEWKRFETEMLSELARSGVGVKRCYACLDDPEKGKGKHLRDSVFFLPNTGAMYHARQHDGVNLTQSWVIGDTTLELAAGWRAGCRTAGVRTGAGMSDDELQTDVSFIGDDLAGVLNEILQLARAARN